MQHLRETGGGRGTKGVYLFYPFNLRLSTVDRFERLSAVAVVRSSGDAHAAKFILVILLVEDVPLLAAFEDFFLLRSDSLADFQLDLFFVFQRGGQNLHHLL